MKGDVVADFWRGRRVFVTGHTGFKGGWLALWLSAMGAEVTGLSDGVPTEPSLFELARVGETSATVRADVRDAGAVQRARRGRAPGGGAAPGRAAARAALVRAAARRPTRST